jgi:16S rRNA (cytosine1402-N4)-methyltransferase
MHKSVLLKEVIDGLQVQNNETFVDMTLGNAGHTKAIFDTGVTGITFIGIDADATAIVNARETLQPYISQVHNNNQFIFETTYFDSLKDILKTHQLQNVDKVLFDLGIRSDQVDDADRGFSFKQDGPLDMSFQSSVELEKRENKITASEIVNEWQEDSIADIIYGFGEEKFSRRIARKIVEVREEKKKLFESGESETDKIETTTELAEIVKSSVPVFYRYGKIHPATKTFQALRIAVNSELERFKTALNDSFELLNSNGRIAVISFHSLEDRITKNFFKEKVSTNQAEFINKKPIIAGEQELSENPRARSAKLRIIKKI